MMNEHQVAPPFGMWNRISAELDAEATPVPVSVNSPIPQRAILGFIAGALLIGASLVTAYLVDNSSNKQSQPTGGIALNTHQTPAFTPVNTEAPVVVAPKQEVKLAVRSSKPRSIAKPVEENVVAPAETVSTPAQTLPTNTEVSVPSQNIAQNNGVSEPYYFPAIDVNTPETKTQVAAPVTKTVKADTKPTDDDDRDVVSNDPPRIKFHPKKHRSFSYGRIIRKR